MKTAEQKLRMLRRAVEQIRNDLLKFRHEQPSTIKAEQELKRLADNLNYALEATNENHPDQ